ncbi:Holliday junction branch migration protein RuvA [Auritidibacter ignavus]|uniref:Holliday junction branch migration protein RuvA n=1 Tax=Auritidibacter ignavus TaxID=678932 RepID=UPI00109C4609|nr:Holliday junction branch migration protein RuvA [Auritidibacter ignavus]
MISSLTGVVEYLGVDAAVLNVNGVGYTFFATPQTLATLRVEDQARVLTELIVREDAMTLYGFRSRDEREIFTTMLTISGIGPRIALAVLAVYAPEEVRRAVAQDDDKAFTQVPGIGAKTARRIILELSGKLVPTEDPEQPGRPSGATPGNDPVWQEQVHEALTGLGWTDKDATKALKSTLEHEPELRESQDVSQVLRATLRHLGQGQRRLHS